jgi:osmotically-inducible protein OsmY
MRKWLHRGGLPAGALLFALSAFQSSAAAETMTGCLEKADGGFTFDSSGKRLTVTGNVDFEKHSGHTVKLTGEESGASFRATALEHVSPQCDSSSRSADTAANLPTASDQGNSKADVEMTAKVRRAIVEDDELSVAAHNVTIVTRDGKVTLRGDVDSLEEKAAVAAKAQTVTGSAVDNMLTVKADSNEPTSKGDK